MSEYTSLQSLGPAQVMVTYEYEPPDLPGVFGSRSDGPRTPAIVNIISVLVNGEEVDAEYFAEHVIEQWEESILEEMRE